MSEKFRWGILGAASIGHRLIPAIQASTNGAVAAIASRSREKAGQWAKQYGIPLALGSYEELLDRRDLDGVYIPLPNSLHSEWTIRALRAGLPVLCEKPIAVSAAEAEKMLEASRATGRYLAEAFMYRFHPVFAKVRELIEAGEIGRMSTIGSRFTFRLEDRSELPARDDLAGGCLMDVGCYCVNVSRLLAGAEPTRVAAFERRTNVDDTMIGMLEFPCGTLAQFETSIEDYERHRVEVAGDLGAIILEDPWLPGEKDTAIILRRQDRPDERVVVPGALSYRLMVEEFVEVCRGRKQPTWGFADAVNNMLVIDALFRSAREGRAVTI